mmetsp:Transcript_34990/g.40434  ORF Transcript_34990/g.40434 Transcript_34990/m.40434 type:complete len:164 (+) Transcript_34990:47-538(+)
MKLVFLIIVFARKDEYPSPRVRRELYNAGRSREDIILQNIFRSHQEFHSLHSEANNGNLDEEEQQRDEISIEQLERRERRNRRRRILRHLRSRGVQEGTINAIRSILEAALERHERDSPEERVKIYSRIERVVYDNDKYGKGESCPICCAEFEDNHHVKIIPG